VSELTKEHRRAYLLSGDATATVVSKKTGARFTYRVRKGEDKLSPHFVSVLTGPENTSNYTFLGTIFADGAYRHGKKSPIPLYAPSAAAFAWSWAHLESEELQVYHLGRCGRCGRPLTTPESIERGLGPVCAGVQ
jgi:hypothetical protein